MTQPAPIFNYGYLADTGKTGYIPDQNFEKTNREDLQLQMRQRLLSPAGKEIYKKRRDYSPS